MPQQRERYLLVDGLRGLSIVNMVLFHFCYDVFMVYGVDVGWYYRPWARLWQQYICWSFLLIAGFSWRWGRKNALKRGVFINLCGGLVTAVTVLAMPQEAIWFGILTCIGCCVLLVWALRPLLEKIPPAAGIAGSFLLFALFYNAQLGYIGLAGWRVALPQVLYRCRVLTPLGFPYPGFFSSDYFPLLPWFFLFVAGYFFYPLFDKRESWKKAARTRIPLLSALGQKSIWVYLAHQPLCMLVCMLMFGF